MKLAHFIGIVLAALFAALIGSTLLSKQQGEQSFEQKVLIERFDFDSVHKIQIRGQAEQVHLNKQLVDWQVAEFNGYAVDMDKLSKLLQELKTVEIQEYKTRNSENYHRLGLTEEQINESDSVLITLVNNDTKVSVLLGNEAKSGVGRYAKLGVSEQTYLLDENIEVKAKPKAWLKKRILPITFDQVKRLNWSDNEGAKFSIERKEQESIGELALNQGQPVLPTGEVKLKPNFELVVPEGEHSLMYESVLNGLVRNTVQVELQNVVPSSTMTLAEQEAIYTIELISQSKLDAKPLVLKLYQLEQEQYWLVVEGKSWAYQISEFSYKQLGKPVQDYLAE